MNAAMSKRYHLTTFGCQMNEHDSERMRGMLESLGYAAAGERDDDAPVPLASEPATPVVAAA